MKYYTNITTFFSFSFPYINFLSCKTETRIRTIKFYFWTFSTYTQLLMSNCLKTVCIKRVLIHVWNKSIVSSIVQFLMEISGYFQAFCGNCDLWWAYMRISFMQDNRKSSLHISDVHNCSQTISNPLVDLLFEMRFWIVHWTVFIPFVHLKRLIYSLINFS